jgi:hypothetical protein
MLLQAAFIVSAIVSSASRCRLDWGLHCHQRIRHSHRPATLWLEMGVSSVHRIAMAK